MKIQKTHLKKIFDKFFTKDIRGAHISDSTWKRWRRYQKYEKAVLDSFQLFTEVRDTINRLFPYKLKQREIFKIRQSNFSLQKFFEDAFLPEGYSENIYNDKHLTDWFEAILHDLMIYGKAYYYIEWELNENVYLPIFYRLSPETIFKIRIPFRTAYLQLYNPLTRIREPYYELRNRLFNKDQIIEFTTEFSKPLLVNSLKYAKNKRDFFNQSLNKQHSYAEPTNYMFNLQKARYSDYSTEKRNHLILLGKLYAEMNFKEMISNQVPMTDYYNIYTLIRHWKYLNDLRDLLVKQFQKQVLERVKDKNKLSEFMIEINRENVKNNDYVNNIFDKYKSGEITFEAVFDEFFK